MQKREEEVKRTTTNWIVKCKLEQCNGTRRFADTEKEPRDSQSTKEKGSRLSQEIPAANCALNCVSLCSMVTELNQSQHIVMEGEQARGSVGIAKPFTIFRPTLWAHFYARLPRCQGNADKMALKKQTKQARDCTTACIPCKSTRYFMFSIFCCNKIDTIALVLSHLPSNPLNINSGKPGVHNKLWWKLSFIETN